MRLYEFDAKAEAKKEFEEVLFGDAKGDPERDTEEEEIMYDAIAEFIEDPSTHNKNRLFIKLQHLKKFKEVFPNDLEPEASRVYRGTTIQTSKLFELFDNSDNLTVNEKGYLEIPFVYQPKSNVQSWTTSYHIATRFAEVNGPSRANAILYTDNVDDSFVMNVSITNLISNVRIDRKENEIIRASGEPIKCQLMLYDHNKNVTKETIESLKNKENRADLLNVILNPLSIAGKHDQTEEMQLIAVKLNPMTISYINNPTEKVELTVLKQDPKYISKIFKPSVAAQCFAVNHNYNLVKLIKGTPDVKAQIIVVKKSYEEGKKGLNLIREINMP